MFNFRRYDSLADLIGFPEFFIMAQAILIGNTTNKIIYYDIVKNPERKFLGR